MHGDISQAAVQRRDSVVVCPGWSFILNFIATSLGSYSP